MTELNTTDFHLPYNSALVARAKDLRKNMTPAERKIWYRYLRSFKFRVFRQRPIDHFIVDFYCPALKLVIEIDGESHFTEEGQEYDRARTQRLESYGLKIVRFTNYQILADIENVGEVIHGLIPPSPPTLREKQKGGELIKVPLLKGDLGGSSVSNEVIHACVYTAARQEV